MTVPGVNLIVAATFLGPRRHRRFRGAPATDRLPRTRSAACASPESGPTRHGKISKQGSAAVREALVEAAWSAVRNPGPMRAFYQRVRARRGHQIAIVATARKLAGLFWCLLTREQDYAYGRPSLTAPSCAGWRSPPALRAGRSRGAGRQSRPRRRRTPSSPNKPKPPTSNSTERPRKRVRADTGTRMQGPRRAKPRGRPKPRSCASLRQSPAATHEQDATASKPHLTFSVQESRRRAVASGASGRSSDR